MRKNGHFSIWRRIKFNIKVDGMSRRTTIYKFTSICVCVGKFLKIVSDGPKTTELKKISDLAYMKASQNCAENWIGWLQSNSYLQAKS
jgi:hypothetical protein